MKIKKITQQLRRDFTAIFECEHCGFEEKLNGYDDTPLHVVSSMKCDQCGKTAGDQPEPSLGYCDGCDELEAELHLVDGDWICDTCKATVIAVQEDKAIFYSYKSMVEAVEDLKTDCTDHWEMIKARVFITLFLVWVCFAVWGKYVS